MGGHISFNARTLHTPAVPLPHRSELLGCRAHTPHSAMSIPLTAAYEAGRTGMLSSALECTSGEANQMGMM